MEMSFSNNIQYITVFVLYFACFIGFGVYQGRKVSMKRITLLVAVISPAGLPPSPSGPPVSLPGRFWGCPAGPMHPA